MHDVTGDALLSGVVTQLPERCTCDVAGDALFVGNSMPIRDIDAFGGAESVLLHMNGAMAAADQVPHTTWNVIIITTLLSSI